MTAGCKAPRALWVAAATADVNVARVTPSPSSDWRQRPWSRSKSFITHLHCARAAAQCIVIGPVCGCVWVFVCGWVCYHDNSKLRASILAKLGL